MTEQEIKDNKPDGAHFYAINSNGGVDYYQFKQNEGYRIWLWGWLGCNPIGIDIKPL